MKSKILNLTNNKWKSDPKWVHVGHKISKRPMYKSEKAALVIAAINTPLPTASPITNPIIIGIGQRMSIKERVKLR